MNSSKVDFVKTVSSLDGDVPMLKDIWNFFNTKGMKTVVVSMNSFNTFNIDLELTESLGCPLHLLFDTDECETRWSTLQKTLKERTISEENKELPWLAGVEKRWILARNLKTKKVHYNWNLVKDYCEENKISQIDFLKIEGKDDNEKELVYSILNAGFRPSLVLIRWSGDPDSSVPSMLAAGHLQNAGYRLLEEKNQWFLYLYTDVCMYDTCSWRDTNTQNPMIEYFLKLSSTEQQKGDEQVEKKNAE